MPILGICAGAQMIAGLHKMTLFRDIQKLTALQHKSSNLEAHDVWINSNTPLAKIFGQQKITVNSRHREAVNAYSLSDLQIYATADDGIPEAWGNEEKGILCIQWHPEDFAAQGNRQMQNIYNWLAQKAKDYQA